MEKKKTITLELYYHKNGSGSTYGAMLSLPCTDADIEETNQKLRCDAGEELEVAALECKLVPELENIQTKGKLLEYNALAKSLGKLDESEVMTFRALVAKTVADGCNHMTLKDLINMTFGLNKILFAANIPDDKHLGSLVIKSGMNDTVNALPNNVTHLLDEELIGAIQRKEDDGFYYNGNYYALCGYKPKEVYDGVLLPRGLSPDHAKFRIIRQKRLDTPIPYLNTLTIRESSDRSVLRKIADMWITMKTDQQIKYKAILEAEQPTGLKDCLYLMNCLHYYEFSHKSDGADKFAKEFLLYHLPGTFDSEKLMTMNLHELGLDIMRQVNARVTEYGVISEPETSLFRMRYCENDEDESMFSHDLIEVCGQKALFSNWRLLGSEIPSGHFRYDIRTDDDGNFCTLEPYVVVNYGGTVITKEPIDLGEGGYLTFSEDNSPHFLNKETTLDKFAKSAFVQEEGKDIQL